MTIENNHSTTTKKFKLKINHNIIPQTSNLKYIGVFLDNQLSRQPHIHQRLKNLSSTYGMLFKLRYYVTFSFKLG